jgi:predicted transcriptional regulator
MTTLWDLPPNNGTDTSIAAAASVRDAVTGRRLVVLEALRTHGPMTQEQVGELLGWPIQSVNPRIYELARGGRVRDTGKRRATRSGKSAAVWEVSP